MHGKSDLAELGRGSALEKSNSPSKSASEIGVVRIIGGGGGGGALVVGATN